MDFQTILYESRDQIAFVTFNRPDSLNAMNRQMTRELVDVCEQVEEDSGIRVAIFTGAGEKAFSAGMDLKERAETSFSPIERRQQKLTNKIYTQARAVAAIAENTHDELGLVWPREVSPADVHLVATGKDEAVFAAAEEIFVAHGGRPHWGTVHTQDAEYLRSVYPRFQDFLDVRASVDPDGVFLNDHVRGLLGL